MRTLRSKLLLGKNFLDAFQGYLKGVSSGTVQATVQRLKSRIPEHRSKRLTNSESNLLAIPRRGTANRDWVTMPVPPCLCAKRLVNLIQLGDLHVS